MDLGGLVITLMRTSPFYIIIQSIDVDVHALCVFVLCLQECVRGTAMLHWIHS